MGSCRYLPRAAEIGSRAPLHSQVCFATLPTLVLVVTAWSPSLSQVLCPGFELPSAPSQRDRPKQSPCSLCICFCICKMGAVRIQKHK